MFHISTSKLHKQTGIFKYTLAYHKKAKTLDIITFNIRVFYFFIMSKCPKLQNVDEKRQLLVDDKWKFKIVSTFYLIRRGVSNINDGTFCKNS